MPTNWLDLDQGIFRVADLTLNGSRPFQPREVPLLDTQAPFPIIPLPFAIGLWVMPLAPWVQALTLLARQLVTYHPSLIDQLGVRRQII